AEGDRLRPAGVADLHRDRLADGEQGRGEHRHLPAAAAEADVHPVDGDEGDVEADQVEVERAQVDRRRQVDGGGGLDRAVVGQPLEIDVVPGHVVATVAELGEVGVTHPGFAGDAG